MDAVSYKNIVICPADFEKYYQNYVKGILQVEVVELKNLFEVWTYLKGTFNETELKTVLPFFQRCFIKALK